MNTPSYQAYAPTSYYNTPIPTIDSTISLDEEVKLSVTTAQRSLHESLAEIYSIIVTLDFLEKAFVRDSIKESEYTATCLRLLGQYKTILKSEEVNREFGDLEVFKKEYDMEYPSATARLTIGVPATYENSHFSNGGRQHNGHDHLNDRGGSFVHPNIGNAAAPSAKAVAECTQAFITFMDALSLEYKAKDQLHPLLSDVMSSLNKVASGDFEGRGTLVHWLIKLNSMKANQEMEEEEARQMAFDVENAYNAFYRALK